MPGEEAAMPRLTVVVKSVQRRREELEQVGVRRWNTLDTLVLRALGMFLGAVFVSFLVTFKASDGSAEDYYLYVMLGCLVFAPIALLYIKQYKPPSTVTIVNGSDSLVFTLADHGQRMVSFQQNGELVIADIDRVELDEEAKQVVLTDAPSHHRGEATVVKIDIVTDWPKKQLGNLIGMVEQANQGEFRSCLFDVQSLTAKVIVQILAWSIKDYCANNLFSSWGSRPGLDVTFALIFFCAFFVLTWLTKVFRLPPYSSFPNAPFLGPKGVTEWRVDLGHICSTYILVFVGALPLSVGFTFNRVLVMIQGEILDAADVDASRSDEYGSVILFSVAVYYLVISIVTVALRVHSSAIYRFLFRTKVMKTIMDIMDSWCCPAMFRDLPEEEDSQPPPALAKEEHESLPAQNTGVQAAGQAASARQEQLDIRENPVVLDVQARIDRLEQNVRRLAKAAGLIQHWCGQEDEDEPTLPRRKHWKAATIATADEVNIKTLQFLHAWATLYLVEHIFYIWLCECSRTSADPWAKNCSYRESLALSMLLSVASWVYLYTITGLARQTTVHKAWFELQVQAIPFLVGWTWKGCADDIVDKLKVQWRHTSMTPVYIVLFISLYVFGSLVFHIYMVISRDSRMKYDSLQFD